ncbi:MAG: hypothetical protein Q8Q14_08815, partial [Gemmatimonadales bacterium]|nr:hypothetical protein [Gemmatimonadales bacterium]
GTGADEQHGGRETNGHTQPPHGVPDARDGVGGRASGEFNGRTSSAASSSAVNHKTTLSRGGRAEHDGTAGERYVTRRP